MPSALDILRMVETMKTLPNIAVRLTRMISDDSYSLQAFEEVIRMDPTLVLRVLKIVNSPYYGLTTKVESIAEAVAYLGMDNLRNLIVVDIFKHIVKSEPRDKAFSRVSLWRHSAAVGVTSQMISERIFETKGENAFLCGLIHDIGLILEDQVVPDLFEKAYGACMAGEDHITVYERKEIGTDHAQVGAVLAKDWQLPNPVQTGISAHHDQRVAADPQSIANIIRVAEYLADRLGLTPFRGLVLKLPQKSLDHIHGHLNEYKAIAMDLPEVIKKADEIFGLD